MQKMFRRHSFTLIELLVVVVIIGILAGVLIPRLVGARERANDSARIVKIGQITTAVDLYAQDNGGIYPIASPTTTGTTVAMVADKITPFLSSIPIDAGKGVATVINLDKSCILTGDSFGYMTDPVGKMFAITARMESKKGNTTNCLGTVDSDKKGEYVVVGKGLTYAISLSGESSDNSVYLPEWAWTTASCFCPSGNCTSFNGTITTYNGACTKSVVIPQTINGKTVTAIGDQAFYLKGITSVTIPNSVTSIGYIAFFRNNLTSLTIPDSVVYIGEWGFSRNLLTSVKISNSLPSIERQVFRNNQLTSVTIPNSVTSIGPDAFSYNQLTSVTIPTSVTNIADWAFYNNNLTSVSIPSSVTSINWGAFNKNKLPDSQAFIYARNPDGSEDNTRLVSYGGANTQPIIPGSVTTIGGDAFEESLLTSVTIPNSVTAIEDRAFYRTTLTSITIPASVATIGTQVFEECGPFQNSTDITGFVPNTLQTRNLVGTTWVKQ